MQLIINVRRIGGDRQREFLRRLFPLLRLFGLHALVEMFLALLTKRAHGHDQQAGNDDERSKGTKNICVSHNQLHMRGGQKLKDR